MQPPQSVHSMLRLCDPIAVHDGNSTVIERGMQQGPMAPPSLVYDLLCTSCLDYTTPELFTMATGS